ncbi:glycosyltransferase family 2 protein [Aestuariibaculum sediminum]|uniref:Glycosyltransferase family 2 protein n=1 Tax=Aestuariibaculum sediminum TaxID=2770637 RepID=A0A8J6U8E8_9FLAO|nr:glycosyltransferase family 2 protein [Aestuariibaculum sediminum]MBD0833100.1 glycosyltransferase family 2 protein [Aestuariibaculum sediminum]
MKIVVYMPALNEELTIAGVLNSLPKSICGFQKMQMLVVNDGSVDSTEIIAKECGATVINHTRNKGVGGAFQSAVEFALQNKADVLVSIDADGQFDVNQIPNLVEPIIYKKADFTIGNRFDKGKPTDMPKIKYWGNKKVSNMVSFVSDTEILDASCGFRAYSRECLLSLNLQGQFTYTHETILDLLNKGFKVSQVSVDVKYFEERVSRVANSITKYALKTSSIIFKCLKDYKPLQFFLTIALIVLILGMLLGSFVLWHWVFEGKITPYKSFGFIALALCGMSVFIATLAFLADMLNRIRINQEKILVLMKRRYYD